MSLRQWIREAWLSARIASCRRRQERLQLQLQLLNQAASLTAAEGLDNHCKLMVLELEQVAYKALRATLNGAPTSSATSLSVVPSKFVGSSPEPVKSARSTSSSSARSEVPPRPKGSGPPFVLH